LDDQLLAMPAAPVIASSNGEDEVLTDRWSAACDSCVKNGAIGTNASQGHRRKSLIGCYGGIFMP
jgi:hypothetical protein